MAVMKNGQKKPLDDHIRDKQAGDDGIESAIPSDETQKEILRKVMSDLTSSNSDISSCGPPPVTSLKRSIDLLLQGNSSKAIEMSESLISLATEKFYAFPHKDVPSCWRRLHVDASIVKSIAQACEVQELQKVVETLDMALIVAGGEGKQQEIHRLLDALDDSKVTKRIKLDIPKEFNITPPEIKLKYPIERRPAPSVTAFEQHMNDTHTPLILTDSISHWPALSLWKQPSHLLKRTLNGTRIVPIELGSSYVSESWSQNLISFSEFLSTHLLHNTDPKGYLAQHDLLSQIPGFYKDISTPDYCYTSPPRDPPDGPQVQFIETEDVMRNIWLGPAGTRSPLHNDPYENIFAQVVGYKYFRLYSPTMTEKVYPRGIEGGIQMGNTSQVDVENPDSERFPLFKVAKFVEGVLGPGDCLYIPRGWWHFVRSESVSIGVSFWW